MAIQISSTTVIDNSRNLTNIANATTSATANTYVLRGADGKISSTSLPLAKGDSFEGGYLMCCFGGVYWIVSPYASQVTRCWDCRNDANTRAQEVSGCTGWFVPTQTQLINPGVSFKVFWDGYDTGFYWSSTEYSPSRACNVNISTGCPFYALKGFTCPTRSFRCVTY